MRQKPSKNADLRLYSRITKVEHENRERNFQVFISGANKERLKIRDLQQEAQQISKKAQVARKPKAPENTLGRRKVWHKSSEIRIKGSNGSDFALVNQKSDTTPEGAVLHDITPKINFHQTSQKNSQLNCIRNRYKAYFHVDGYGFCCSKKASNPSTPVEYRVDKASLNLNRRHQRHTQDSGNNSHLTSPQVFDNEEQRDQYYGLLDKNNTLREFLTPDYEFFKTAKEIRAPATEANASCNGIVYDCFYHKDQSICQSARALFPPDNRHDIGSICGDDGHVKVDHDKLRIFEDGGAFYEDERALVLLENQVLDDNVEMPPLRKALSPVAKLVKSSYNHRMEEKEYGQPFLASDCHDIKSLSNCGERSNLKLNLWYLREFKNPEQPTFLDLAQFEEKGSHNDKSMDCGPVVKRSNLKLNLRYLRNPEQLTFVDPVQSEVGGGTSDDYDDDGSSRTQECESSTTTTSSITESYQTWKSNEKVASVEDVTWNSHPICNDRENGKTSNLPDTVERITKTHGTLLIDRVKKLDLRKQVYLANVLDKLEISHVKSGSVDHDFCQSGHLLI